ncbi:glycosyltransferase family 2 protein [Anoxybacteroides tepidamans]|uniref:tetratricopeptide repeat-containing glycosyltransferase family 2 protein n=1 Tax=Anoxybacteroides tepidamans TaxID=265948 RepID=UPI000553F8EC|nr:glycosyltransferase family 2 protein [Anoxybacillus tepidamans]
MKPLLSLCMIVKNEEKVLQRCLDSVYGIVDEIIIVDTGSEDRTKEIALQYVDRVYEFEWTNSFADARNYAQQHANGEWILVLDADEYVDRSNLTEMVKVLRQTNENTDAYDVTIYNFMGTYGERVLQHRNTRLYRNIPNIRYHRAIHEQLRREDGQPLNAIQGLLNVYHSGYMHQTITEKDKHQRNAPLIEKELQARENVAFDYFNLGNEYLSKGEIEKAIQSFLKAYKEKTDFRLSWVSFCIVQIVLCLKYLERFHDALNVIADAEKLYSITADFKYLKGEIYYLQHRYDDALLELNELVQNKDKYTHCVKTFEYLEYDPHMLLGHIYKHKGDIQSAIQHYTSALSVNNKSYEALYHVLLLLSRFHNEEEIIQFLEKRNWFESDQSILLLLRVVISLRLSTVAQFYTGKLKEKTIQKGFQIKINILQKKYGEALEEILKNSVQSLEMYIKTGSLDLYDVLVASLSTNKFEVVRLLFHLVSDEKEKEFLWFIMNEAEQASEPAFYIRLLERTLQLKEYNLFERLIQLKETFDQRIHIELGHLLHRYEFIELALDLYQCVDNVNELDAQSFINIIEGLSVKNQLTNAVQYGLQAISLGYNDFRLYKYVIELMKLCGMWEERKFIIRQALDIYSDSKWLMQQDI